MLFCSCTGHIHLTINFCLIEFENYFFLVSAESIFNENEKYLIHTSSCKIPKTDIFNDELAKLVNRSWYESLKRPYCYYTENKYTPTLIGKLM